MINLSKLAALAKATPTELAQSTSADALAQEKLTRRAALRRIGMTGAMTVLGVLSIDELARVAAKKLDEHEMTRGLAKDFKDAGVAMAGPAAPSPGCHGDCIQSCNDEWDIETKACGPEPKFYYSWLGPIADWVRYQTSFNYWTACLHNSDTTWESCLDFCARIKC